MTCRASAPTAAFYRKQTFTKKNTISGDPVQASEVQHYEVGHVRLRESGVCVHAAYGAGVFDWANLVAVHLECT